jgi:hypothetical protein
MSAVVIGILLVVAAAGLFGLALFRTGPEVQRATEPSVVPRTAQGVAETEPSRGTGGLPSPGDAQAVPDPDPAAGPVGPDDTDAPAVVVVRRRTARSAAGGEREVTGDDRPAAGRPAGPDGATAPAPGLRSWMTRARSAVVVQRPRQPDRIRADEHRVPTSVRVRAAFLLAIGTAGVAVLVGAVLSIVVVGAVLLVV